jgi:hypothetical protein
MSIVGSTRRVSSCVLKRDGPCLGTGHKCILCYLHGAGRYPVVDHRCANKTASISQSRKRLARNAAQSRIHKKKLVHASTEGVADRHQRAGVGNAEAYIVVGLCCNRDSLDAWLVCG